MSIDKLLAMGQFADIIDSFEKSNIQINSDFPSLMQHSGTARLTTVETRVQA